MRDDYDIMTDAKTLYDFHAFNSLPPVSKVMLIAGSHDVRVAEFASDLFLAEAAELMVCSGGSGKVTGQVWDRPEAEIFAEIAVGRDVPRDKIVIEPNAKNSGENFTLTREVLDALGIRPSHVTIVCKPYMARRALATATKQWAEVNWSVRVPPIGFEEYPTEDTPLERMINLMVGDLQRLHIYAIKGFQSPVDVPASIWAAYNRLVDDGYRQFVLKS